MGGPFLSPSATPEEIDEAGRKIFCLIYNEEDEHFNLDNIRKKNKKWKKCNKKYKEC